jgi:hypothetical protein
MKGTICVKCQHHEYLTVVGWYLCKAPQILSDLEMDWVEGIAYPRRGQLCKDINKDGNCPYFADIGAGPRQADAAPAP